VAVKQDPEQLGATGGRATGQPASTIAPVQEQTPTAADQAIHTPDWVADAVFYQIFPDRFARSGRVDNGVRLEAWDAEPTFTGYKGGDLWGLADNLDHLVDLGVTAIYLNPIFQSASNHRYHTHDYFRVDPLLGGDEAFDALIAAAHARNIRVVLDGVFNHASRGFFQFSDIAEHQEKSAYVDWFRVREFPIRPYDEDTPASYDAWWGLHALPAFNTETEAVREFLWDVGTHWMERGIDGWRLDVPNEIATPGFWEEFRARVRAINPDAYIVGEIWSSAEEWVGSAGRFDGVMNYKLTTAIIAFAIGNRINPVGILNNYDYDVTPGLNAAEFADRIDWIHDIYDEQTQRAMLNLLDSHDTARIRTIADDDAELVSLALTLLFVFPGAPSIYYGTEVGLSGGPDPQCRRGMEWDPTKWDNDVYGLVKQLIALRATEPGLRSAGVERIGPRPDTNFGRTYVMARGAGADRLLIAVNHADEADDVPLPTEVLPADAQRIFGTAERSATGLRMPPRSVGIWKAPEHERTAP
jgi:glycosidase